MAEQRNAAALGRPAQGRRGTAQWNDLGKVHPDQRREGPVTVRGLLKSFGSGALDSVLSTGAEFALTPQGIANHLDTGTALSTYILRKSGLLSPEQAERAAEAQRRWRKTYLGPTTHESQKAAGLYHAPENRAEAVAETAGAIAPNVLLGPEGLIKGGLERMGLVGASRMALRGVRPLGNDLGKEAVWKLARARAAALEAGEHATNIAIPTVATEATREVARRSGLDEADTNALMLAAGLGVVPTRLRPRAPGDRWSVNKLPPEQVLDISSTGRPAAALPSDREYARRWNALSYHTDGLTPGPTKGDLRRAATADAQNEKRRAIREGRPYRQTVGHAPDATATGTADPVMGYIDQHAYSQSSLGGLLGSRQGQRIRVIKIDGVAHGLPSKRGRLIGGAVSGTVAAGAAARSRRLEDREEPN